MRRTLLRACLGVCLAQVLLALPAFAGEPIAIVVSREWAGMEAISITTLRRIYLGRVDQIAGRRVEPFDLRSGSPAREAMTRVVLGRSEDSLREYWLEQALTGGALPPREVPSAARMIEQVRKHPGAIGYVPLGALEGEASGLRVLRVVSGADTLLPGDSRYPIRER